MSTVHETVDRLQAALLAHDMQAFADEWAPHGTMTFPFAPAGWPSLTSRDDVRAYLSGYTETLDVRGIRHQTCHAGADSRTVVVEWGVTGVVVATGQPYDLDYICVITVGDQGIESYRDYWNPLAIADAMGGSADMAAAFAMPESTK
jgi:ketosteroid isomerase-like protein